MKTLLIFGGTGFIGRHLIELVKDEYKIVILSRNPEKYTQEFNATVRLEKYELSQPEKLTAMFESAFAVINLSGENIGKGSWNSAYKKKILNSRLETGNFVKSVFNTLKTKPSCYIHGSATGYYGINPSDAKISEERPSTRDSFLTDVTIRSEENVQDLQAQTRLVFLRTGIVLARDAGALPQMAMPFKMFAGGPLGSGKQWIPWIHITDEVAAIRYLLQHGEIAGPVNLTAPLPVRQKDFAKALGKALHRPSFIPAPAFALKLLLGKERAKDLLLSGLRIVPEKLLSSGFKFRFKTITEALDDIYQD